MHVQRWRILISILLTLAIGIFVVVNFERIRADFALLAHAQPHWLLLAFALILLSYLISSQVFVRALTSLGYRVRWLPMWGTAVTAIVISQSFPAGGVASYAFLMQSLRRRGIASGHSALVASLEVMSYVCAMLLMFGFSVIFFTLRHGLGATNTASFVAAGVAVVAVSAATFVLTRNTEQLSHWFLGAKGLLERLLRRSFRDEPLLRLAEEIHRGREMFLSRWQEVLYLVFIQLIALCGHSMAMLLVLRSLEVQVSPLVVIAAFGVTLITSSFNVLPGGGGTVETALAWMLANNGAGAAAIPAAVIFRLLNFWLLLPVAVLGYQLLMRQRNPAIEAQRLPDKVS